MTRTNSDGQERKSLASQLDRLDSILDGLSEGLQQAVAAAVQEAVASAVREAIQAVMTEVLTNPDLLALLRASVARPAHEAAAEPVKARRKVSLFAPAWAWTHARIEQARSASAGALRRVATAAAGLWGRLSLVRRHKVQLLTALLVGTAAGVGAYYAGPWLAAGVAWLGGFVTALVVQAGSALRRAVGPIAAP